MIAKCAEVMRAAASKVDSEGLAAVVKARGKAEGDYQGGLVSISLRPLDLLLICLSAILWALEVIHTTRLISLPRRPFLALPCFS